LNAPLPSTKSRRKILFKVTFYLERGSQNWSILISNKFLMKIIITIIFSMTSVAILLNVFQAYSAI
jgi:hypothetical protein